MLTVTTPATSKRLAQPSDVVYELGLSGAEATIIITDMVDQASAAIVSYCNREFALETVEETLPTTGSCNLMLTRTPIASISSITFNGVTVPATDYFLTEPEAGFVFNPNGWGDSAQRTYGLSGTPVQNSRAYLLKATYSAGYVPPGFTGTPAMPYDIERACIELVKSLWLGRKLNPNIESESVPDVGSVKYRTITDIDMLMPPTVKQLLSRWRRAL